MLEQRIRKEDKKKHRLYLKYMTVPIYGDWEISVLTVQVKIRDIAVMKPVGIDVGVDAGTNLEHLEVI